MSLISSQNEPILGLILARFLARESSRAMLLQINEPERAELIFDPKFPSSSEPSQMFNLDFRARASRAVARSTSTVDMNTMVYSLAQYMKNVLSYKCNIRVYIHNTTMII